ncbi:MAG: hypothetical protein ACE37B_19540 [Ilumatobacter sp.]|uniref:hypothetical protein n=1 Tax=Ilumatobacter sp. TaxID=1967498 RepID=UPI00391E038C
MITELTEPIDQHWTRTDLDGVSVELADTPATAVEVNRRLATFEVGDIDRSLVPYLAAAAAELAMLANVAWRFSGDDAPVALLRLIAKITIRHPEIGGPHTHRLLEQLTKPSP